MVRRKAQSRQAAEGGELANDALQATL